MNVALIYLDLHPLILTELTSNFRLKSLLNWSLIFFENKFNSDGIFAEEMMCFCF